MRRRDEQLDDLVQVASIGLLNAIDRFDPTFDVSFHTYASTTILGELRRHYRSTWRVSVPRRLQERYLLLNHATEHLTTKLQRTPTVAEIAAWLGLQTDEIIEAMAIGATTWISELDEPDAVTDDPAARHDNQLLASELLARLPRRDRTILVSWLVDGLTQQEIGQRVGLTQVQVSRAARRSLNTLRSLAGSIT
jgi:RNA polymerase sigma-B factor